MKRLLWVLLLFGCKKESTEPPIQPPLQGGIVLTDNQSLRNVTVQGGDTGIVIAGSNITIENVTIKGAGFAGIATRYTDYPSISKRNIQIINCIVTGTTGNAGQRPHTGHGIVLGGVDGGLISGCTTNENGYPNGEGNIGQWCYDSRNITIQNGISKKNISTGLHDGGGFDIDGGSSNCTIINCTSEGNTGAGFLVYDYGSPNPMRDNSVINCITSQDGQKDYLSSFFIGGEKPLYNTTISGNKATPLAGKEALIIYKPQNVIGLSLTGNNW